MKLSILIVNWNTRDLVVKCLNAALKNAPPFEFELIVIDNHSSDNSADTLVKIFGSQQKIKILQSAQNLGFAKANNLAFEHASGEFILLLNSDTEVQEGALEELVRYLERNPEVGVVGPKLLNPDGTTQASLRRFPRIWSSVMVFSGLHRFFRPRRYLMEDFDYHNEEAQEVDQVMGAALLTRRRIVSELGFLDEKFWLWYEEVDFCKRVKDAGYQVKYYPKAVVMHEGAQSFSQMNVYERKRVVARSLCYYFQKHGSRFEVVLLEIAVPVVLFTAKLLDYLQKVFKFRIKPHV